MTCGGRGADGPSIGFAASAGFQAVAGATPDGGTTPVEDAPALSGLFLPRFCRCHTGQVDTQPCNYERDTQEAATGSQTHSP